MDKKALQKCITYAMIGDAIGFLVEGKSQSEVQKLCNILNDDSHLDKIKQFNQFEIEDWITGEKYTPGQISDDSQSMIALAESFTEQNNDPFLAFAQKMAKLFKNNEMVGYGYTTKNAIERFMETGNLNSGELERPTNGSVMRVAPLGILFSDNDDALVQNCILQSQITHAHPLAILSSVVFGSAISAFHQNTCDMRSFSHYLRQNIQKCEKFGIKNSEHTDYIYKFINFIDEIKSIEQARTFILQEDQKITTIPQYKGISTHAVTCTFWAIYINLLNQNSSLEKILSQTIHIGGDTDTVACLSASLASFHAQHSEVDEKWVHNKGHRIKITH